MFLSRSTRPKSLPAYMRQIRFGQRFRGSKWYLNIQVMLCCCLPCLKHTADWWDVTNLPLFHFTCLHHWTQVSFKRDTGWLIINIIISTRWAACICAYESGSSICFFIPVAFIPESGNIWAAVTDRHADPREWFSAAGRNVILRDEWLDVQDWSSIHNVDAWEVDCGTCPQENNKSPENGRQIWFFQDKGQGTTQ